MGYFFDIKYFRKLLLILKILSKFLKKESSMTKRLDDSEKGALLLGSEEELNLTSDDLGYVSLISLSKRGQSIKGKKILKKLKLYVLSQMLPELAAIL